MKPLKHLRILAVLAFGIVFANGCSSAKPRVNPIPTSNNVPPAEQMGPPEPFGPNPAEVLGPVPDEVRSVVLVLGPGLATGFAHVGVIRELKAEHIPISAILGAEMGALVGGIYAYDQSINRFEFHLQRFKEDLFKPQTGLFSALSGDRPEKFRSTLSHAFGTKDLSDFKVPFWVALTPAGASGPTVTQKGNAVSAIAAATANPAIFPAARWENSDATSAPKSLDRLVQEARTLNRGVVMVVSVDGSVPADRGDIFIAPDLSGIGAMDFDRMTETAFRGKAAATAKLAQVKQLVGLE